MNMCLYMYFVDDNMGHSHGIAQDSTWDLLVF